MKSASSRMPLIDALKALAAQFIVFHHLVHYGPMADVAQPLAPGLVSWFDEFARMAVQVFLVVGGFLAARSLAPYGQLKAGNPFSIAWKRYLRLVVPFMVAMGFAALCSEGARHLMVHDSISPRPELGQMLAHLFLMHKLLDFESLSAGAWYVAVDFQLYILFACVLWLAVRLGLARYVMVPVVALSLASLFYFNRDGAYEDWAVYFFGAYGMGITAFWAQRRQCSSLWMLLLSALVVVALAVDFRWRILVAFVTTVLLLGLDLPLMRTRLFDNRMIAWLSQISFSVFLVHFPICLLVNGLFTRFFPGNMSANAAGVFLAWGASVAAGAVFHRYVESVLVFGQKPVSAPKAVAATA